MKSRQTADHAIGSRGSKRIDLVWRSCVSVGRNNNNEGFAKAGLERNEAITLLGCSFSSHGLIRTIDQSKDHFGIGTTPVGRLLRRKAMSSPPTAVPRIMARSEESRGPLRPRGENMYRHCTITTPQEDLNLVV